MPVRHWLIGCLLCVAGLGNAAATSMDTQQDQDGCSHGSNEGSGARENGGSGGDALGLNRDGPQHAASTERPTSASGNSNDRSGGAASAPTPIRQSHLGWQSLLPGSIQ